MQSTTPTTLKAVKEYITKVKELGYTVNGEVPELDYDTDLRIPNALGTAIMVLMVYLILIEILGKNSTAFFVAAIIVSALGAVCAFVVPQSLKWVFPTGWAVLSPCFALTFTLSFIRSFKDKLRTVPLAICVTGVLVGIMSILGIVQSSLLSGINYYVNNEIFRGIKLSLFIPLIFAGLLFIIYFIRIDFKKLGSYFSGFKLGDIKISWLVLVLIVFLAVYKVISVYITRSGNVNSISALETWMRNLITDIFKARPRTKEFLVGYPCLILFVYYIKNTNIKILQGLLFCGAAITAASISNSFCHVFTTVETIYGRVVNGVIIGAVICIAVYIINIILVKVVSNLFKKYLLPTIEKNEKLYNIYRIIIGERN